MGTTVEVVIEKVVAGGAGLGRWASEGRSWVVFVARTASGDRVTAEVQEVHKGHLKARLVEVLEAGPGRTTPPCEHATVCGGCSLMHIDGATQRETKRLMVADAFKRIGRMEVTVEAVIASPEDQGYRARAHVRAVWRAASADGPSGFVMGFFEEGTHRVVDTPGCLVLDRRLADWLKLARGPVGRFLDSRPHARLGLDLAVDLAGRIGVGLMGFDEGRALGAGPSTPTGPSEVGLKPLALQLGALPGTGWVRFDGDEEADAATVTPLQLVVEDPLDPERTAAVNIAYEPGTFTQIHPNQNQTLVTLVTGLVLETSPRPQRVLDLYAGIAQYGLILARHVSQVTAVEWSRSAVEHAREAAKGAGIANLDVVAEDAARYLASLAPGAFDCVVLNPPRDGARGMDLLAKVGAKRIVYVSCDPPTLARDCAQLVRAGYSVSRVVPIDMFPHTHHVETVVCLEAP